MLTRAGVKIVHLKGPVQATAVGVNSILKFVNNELG